MLYMVFVIIKSLSPSPRILKLQNFWFNVSLTIFPKKIIKFCYKQEEFHWNESVIYRRDGGKKVLRIQARKKRKLVIKSLGEYVISSHVAGLPHLQNYSTMWTVNMQAKEKLKMKTRGLSLWNFIFPWFHFFQWRKKNFNYLFSKKKFQFLRFKIAFSFQLFFIEKENFLNQSFV